MNANAETEKRVYAAPELTVHSTLPIKEIRQHTHPPLDAFRPCLKRLRREPLFARHDIELTAEWAPDRPTAENPRTDGRYALTDRGSRHVPSQAGMPPTIV